MALDRVKARQKSDEQTCTPSDIIGCFLVPFPSHPSSVIREDPAKKSGERAFFSVPCKTVDSNTRDFDLRCLGSCSGIYVKSNSTVRNI